LIVDKFYHKGKDFKNELDILFTEDYKDLIPNSIVILCLVDRLMDCK